MTEAEWLAARDPQPMLDALRRRAGGRKLRLFACACCRDVMPLLVSRWPAVDERLRHAVGACEQEAEEPGGPRPMWDDYWACCQDLRSVVTGRPWPEVQAAARAVRSLLDWWQSMAWSQVLTPRERAVRAACAARDVARAAAEAVKCVAGANGRAARAGERARQAHLVRDLFGNPFRPAPRVDPTWLAWNGGTVRKLAEGIYAERAFDRLPILADALEDAGCTDAALLSHCRSAGEHMRGCWPVDLLLGKG
jgi:hypothetical protein